MTTPTPEAADSEVRQLVVHPAVWQHLTDWLNARGIDVNLMTPAGDDLATYVMSPRDLNADEPPTTPDALRRAQLRKLGRAMSADAPETAAVRPQDATEGAPESPAASEALSGAQAAAQPFVTVQGRCPACGWQSLFLGDGGYVTCSRVECGDPCAATDLLERDTRQAPPAPGDGLRERIDAALFEFLAGPYDAVLRQRATDAVMAVVQPYLNQLAGLHESFHVVDQQADRAEAALARVRAECDALDSVLGYLSPVAREAQREAVRCIRVALTGTDTPTEQP